MINIYVFIYMKIYIYIIIKGDSHVILQTVTSRTGKGPTGDLASGFPNTKVVGELAFM